MLHPKNMKRILLLQIFFALFIIPCSAQNPSGKIKGFVVDWQDARVLGTTITFQNKQFRKTVTVNSDGEYEIELPVGSYVITAQKPNFREYRFKSLKITANKMRTFNIKLALAPVKQVKCPEGQLCL